MKFYETLKLTHFEWNYIRNSTLIGLMKLIKKSDLNKTIENDETIRHYIHKWNLKIY